MNIHKREESVFTVLLFKLKAQIAKRNNHSLKHKRQWLISSVSLSTWFTESYHLYIYIYIVSRIYFSLIDLCELWINNLHLREMILFRSHFPSNYLLLWIGVYQIYWEFLGFDQNKSKKTPDMHSIFVFVSWYVKPEYRDNTWSETIHTG